MIFLLRFVPPSRAFSYSSRVVILSMPEVDSLLTNNFLYPFHLPCNRNFLDQLSWSTSLFENSMIWILFCVTFSQKIIMRNYLDKVSYWSWLQLFQWMNLPIACKHVRQPLAPSKTTARLLDLLTLLTEVHWENVSFNLLISTKIFSLILISDLLTLADSPHYSSTANAFVIYCSSTDT